MAISNITKFITNVAFPVFLIPSVLRRKHEKISSSCFTPLDDFSVKRAFFMLSYDYRFKVLSTQHDLGVCRVHSVCVLADSSIELGLLTSDGYVLTYRFDDLIFYHPSDLRLN